VGEHSLGGSAEKLQRLLPARLGGAHSVAAMDDIRTLSGRIALITGGASGIGLATAREFVARGADVVVADVAAPPADLEARFAQADVSAPNAWAEIASGLDRVDIAVLNAGIQSRTGDLADVTIEEYRRIVGVNLDGVVLGTQTVLPLMRDGGAIVMLASLAGLVAYAPDPLYAATKHAVVGFARAMAPQLAKRGITANVVCPGLTDTAFLTADQRAWVDAARFPLIPVQDIVAAVLGCATGSDTAGVWVCQHGREAMRYEPRGVPGPAGGVTPPAGLAQAPRP
jgi:NAD(P)-dependent dehydrogenase (short-subunit alcohol dehydrogenase family)